MGLFALPVEIRLQIYSELLVHREPIDFLETFRGGSSVFCQEWIYLCPALLRVNKQVYGEAISLLYSDNCFRFSDEGEGSTRFDPTIDIFVRQIGARANLLRHVCTDFPTTSRQRQPPWIRSLSSDQSDDSERQGRDLDNLDLLQDAFSGITTLELSLPSEYAYYVLGDSPAFTKSLDLIQTRLEAFPSLRDVKVDVILYDWESDEESSDGTTDPEEEERDNPYNDQRKTLRNSLRQLCSRGWAVNVSKIPPVEETWSSPGDMVEYMYDNEDELPNYMRADYADDGGPA